MAKVKITGHASGTGVVTITAPNTSTDRTITLPDGTGTLLDENSSLPAANITGTLPAISATNLTNVPAANITGTLPAISGANLTGVRDTTGGRKNLIINGGFDVWQRGTAATSYGNYASADRWKQTTAGEVSKVVDGDRNTVLKLVTSTGQAPNRITQYLEAPARLKGKTLTLSFWMKTSEVLTLDINFWVGDAAGNYPVYGKTGGSAGNSTALGGSTSTSWTKYTTSVVIPSYTEYTNGTDKMEINIGVVNGTAAGKSIYYDDIQLEVGSVATDFEHRSYGEELALCQRYYEVLSTTSDNNRNRYNGVAWDSSNLNIFINFLVEKRADATVAITSIGQVFNGSWVNASGSAVTGAGKRGCTIAIQKTGGYTAKYGYFIRSQAITADAEL